MGKAKPKIEAETQQPVLFSPEMLPDVPALVRAAKEFAHTGKITCKDGQRAELIINHYLQSGSLRATAKLLHYHPRTIGAVLREFEAAGKLDALKERLSRKLAVILELSADDMEDRLTSGELKLSPIDFAVLQDKKLALDGEAISTVRHEVQVDVRVEDVTAYLASKGISAPAIDVESTVNQQKPKEIAP